MRRASLLLVVMLLVGCSREVGAGGPGSPCVRAVQCMPGLACVNGMCSNDLSLLEGGTVPVADAGMMLDAGAPMDAGPGVDGGPRPDGGPRDGGPPRVDGGPPPVDGGPPPVDAGPPPVDAGPPPVDGGPDVDAGT